MADFDVIADTTPQQPIRVTRHYGRKTVSELKTALQAKDATTFTNAEVLKMTYNDLVHAVQVTPTP